MRKARKMRQMRDVHSEVLIVYMKEALMENLGKTTADIIDWQKMKMNKTALFEVIKRVNDNRRAFIYTKQFREASNDYLLRVWRKYQRDLKVVSIVVVLDEEKPLASELIHDIMESDDVIPEMGGTTTQIIDSTNTETYTSDSSDENINNNDSSDRNIDNIDSSDRENDNIDGSDIESYKSDSSGNNDTTFIETDVSDRETDDGDRKTVNTDDGDGDRLKLIRRSSRNIAKRLKVYSVDNTARSKLKRPKKVEDKVSNNKKSDSKRQKVDLGSIKRKRNYRNSIIKKQTTDEYVIRPKRTCTELKRRNDYYSTKKQAIEEIRPARSSTQTKRQENDITNSEATQLDDHLFNNSRRLVVVLNDINLKSNKKNHKIPMEMDGTDLNRKTNDTNDIQIQIIDNSLSECQSTDATVKTDGIVNTDAIVKSDVIFETDAIVKSDAIVNSDATVKTDDAIVKTDAIVKSGAIFNSDAAVKTKATVKTNVSNVSKSTMNAKNETIRIRQIFDWDDLSCHNNHEGDSKTQTIDSSDTRTQITDSSDSKLQSTCSNDKNDIKGTSECPIKDSNATVSQISDSASQHDDTSKIIKTNNISEANSVESNVDLVNQIFDNYSKASCVNIVENDSAATAPIYATDKPPRRLFEYLLSFVEPHASFYNSAVARRKLLCRKLPELGIFCDLVFKGYHLTKLRNRSISEYISCKYKACRDFKVIFTVDYMTHLKVDVYYRGHFDHSGLRPAALAKEKRLEMQKARGLIQKRYKMVAKRTFHVQNTINNPNFQYQYPDFNEEISVPEVTVVTTQTENEDVVKTKGIRVLKKSKIVRKKDRYLYLCSFIENNSLFYKEKLERRTFMKKKLLEMGITCRVMFRGCHIHVIRDNVLVEYAQCTSHNCKSLKFLYSEIFDHRLMIEIFYKGCTANIKHLMETNKAADTIAVATENLLKTMKENVDTRGEIITEIPDSNVNVTADSDINNDSMQHNDERQSTIVIAPVNNDTINVTIDRSVSTHKINNKINITSVVTIPSNNDTDVSDDSTQQSNILIPEATVNDYSYLTDRLAEQSQQEYTCKSAIYTTLTSFIVNDPSLFTLHNDRRKLLHEKLPEIGISCKLCFKGFHVKKADGISATEYAYCSEMQCRQYKFYYNILENDRLKITLLYKGDNLIHRMNQEKYEMLRSPSKTLTLLKILKENIDDVLNEENETTTEEDTWPSFLVVSRSVDKSSFNIIANM